MKNAIHSTANSQKQTQAVKYADRLLSNRTRENDTKY